MFLMCFYTSKRDYSLGVSCQRLFNDSEYGVFVREGHKVRMTDNSLMV